MVRTEIPANDVRIPAHPDQGEVVVITRYGKPEYAVLRWEDFMPIEQLIDQYLVNPPYDLEASDLAVRADEIGEAPEGDDFDFSGLADALKQ
jgi:hypothetical protein